MVSLINPVIHLLILFLGWSYYKNCLIEKQLSSDREDFENFCCPWTLYIIDNSGDIKIQNSIYHLFLVNGVESKIKT